MTISFKPSLYIHFFVLHMNMKHLIIQFKKIEVTNVLH